MVEPEHDPAANRPRPRPPAAPAAPQTPPGIDPQARPAVAGPDTEAVLESSPEPPDEPSDETRPGLRAGPAHARTQGARSTRNRWALVAALVVIVAVVVTAVLLVVHGRSGDGDSAGPSSAAEQAAATITDTAAANAFLAAATTDIVAVTTYDYRSLDTALSNGLTVTAGAYRKSFRTALTGSLAADAKRLHRVQTFALLAAGIGAITKDGSGAKVLIFGVQAVTDDTTGGKARQTLVTLTATLQRQTNRYLLAELSAGQNAGLPAGTAGLRAAAEAGRSEVAAVLTLRHDHFDADYNTALAGAVEPLRGTLSSQAAATRARITKGGYDLGATVTAVAVQRAAGDTLVLLVAATGTRTSNGKATTVLDGRYRVTVVRVGGRWVTSAIDAVTAG